jgi:hypothetical protein
MARPPKYKTEAERTEAFRAQKLASYHRNSDRGNARRNERRARFAAHAKAKSNADTNSWCILTAQQLRRPNFLYIDAAGSIRSESYETAAELERRIKHTNRKMSSKKQEGTP